MILLKKIFNIIIEYVPVTYTKFDSNMFIVKHIYVCFNDPIDILYIFQYFSYLKPYQTIS